LSQCYQGACGLSTGLSFWTLGLYGSTGSRNSNIGYVRVVVHVEGVLQWLAGFSLICI
jgi:hypothetical protein